jgi:hypothetical protein
MSAIKFPDPIFAASPIKKQRKPLQRKSWKLKHNPMRHKMHAMKPAEEAFKAVHYWSDEELGALDPADASYWLKELQAAAVAAHELAHMIDQAVMKLDAARRRRS